MKERIKLLLLTGIFTITSMNMMPSVICAAPDTVQMVSVKYDAKKNSKPKKQTEKLTEAEVVAEAVTVDASEEKETDKEAEVVPETEETIKAPETEATVVVPETEAPVVTPETESTVITVPETEGTVVTPETEEQTVPSETNGSEEQETDGESGSETNTDQEETSEGQSEDASEGTSESETETGSESEAQAESESESEKESESETEPETESETEAPVDVAANYMMIAGEPIYILGQYPTVNINITTNRIYDYLTKKMKMNHAAACGVLANIQCESNFSTTAVGDGGTSYGLCQWHLERFSALIQYCIMKECDFHVLNGQMEFMAYELNGAYEDVYRYLLNVPNTEEGAAMAADYWCRHYEAPNHIDYNSQMRADLAKSAYFPKKLGIKKTKKTQKPAVTKKSNKSTIIVKKAPMELQSLGIHKDLDREFVEDLMQVFEEAARPKF